jgi:hypothetical protein
MEAEWQALLDKYPLTFYRVAWFSCMTGWAPLLDQLAAKLEDELTRQPDKTFRVVQIKEKFGGLRFYADNASARMREFIDAAESESFRICEYCGQSANGLTKNKHGWVRTLCDSCKSNKERVNG